MKRRIFLTALTGAILMAIIGLAAQNSPGIVVYGTNGTTSDIFSGYCQPFPCHIAFYSTGSASAIYTINSASHFESAQLAITGCRADAQALKMKITLNGEEVAIVPLDQIAVGNPKKPWNDPGVPPAGQGYNFTNCDTSQQIVQFPHHILKKFKQGSNMIQYDIIPAQWTTWVVFTQTRLTIQ